MARFRTKLDGMDGLVKSHDASLEDVKHQLDAAIGNFEDLDATLAKHLTRTQALISDVHALEERVQLMEERMAGAVEGALAAMQNAKEAAAVVKVAKGEKQRDNLLQVSDPPHDIRV